MEMQERQRVLAELASSEARLLGLVDGLTAEQWGFRERPGRWSIAENVEHLVLFEEFIRGAVVRALEAPAEPEKTAEVGLREHLVLGLAEARSVRFNAREIVRPTGRWLDSAEMIEELKKTRARTLAFAAETQAALREHFFAHVAFGDLDCYQWLVLLGQHTLRHALQIEQVMADPAYPAAYL
jgi:hypothetical protein